MRDCGVFAVWSSPVVDELSLGTARWRPGRMPERSVCLRCEGARGGGVGGVISRLKLREDSRILNGEIRSSNFNSST